MFKGYKDRVEFLLIYIREAHPADGWQLPANTKDGIVFKEPRNLFERKSIAETTCKKLNLSLPTVIDDMDNTVDNRYAGWPERMFIVDAQGKIAYAGKQGPFGFKPAEVTAWLEKNIGPAKK